jgi:hypothetical protein
MAATPRPAPSAPLPPPVLTTYHPPAWNPTCGWEPTTGTACGQPATWHVLWTTTPHPHTGGAPATFYCTPHMNTANTRFAYTDRHRTSSGCDMPDADWSFDELRCAPTAE